MLDRLTKIYSYHIKFLHIYQFPAIIAKIFTKDTQWQRKWHFKQKLSSC